MSEKYARSKRSLFEETFLIVATRRWSMMTSWADFVYNFFVEKNLARTNCELTESWISLDWTRSFVFVGAHVGVKGPIMDINIWILVEHFILSLHVMITHVTTFHGQPVAKNRMIETCYKLMVTFYDLSMIKISHIRLLLSAAGHQWRLVWR